MTIASRFLDALPPFEPAAGLSNGHAMTIRAWARRRDFPALPAPEARLFQVAPDTQVLGHIYWQARRNAVPTLVAMHGLEGSSAAHYMRGLANKAWARGWNAVLLNQRNCGGTEHLTPTLYHSGLTPDPLSVMRELHARDGLPLFVVVGYSLGGNLAVRIAGEVGDTNDPPIAAVAAVSPTVDLARCVTAIERKRNFPYHWNFVRNLKARMRRKLAARPGVFDDAPLGGIRSIRRFDDVYTAPSHGFGDAATYYTRASALRVVDRIRIPTLILAAEDDPFVPAEQFRDAAIQANPEIGVRIERHGGHCGFIARTAPTGGDAYWAETSAVDFFAAAISERGATSR